MKVAIKKLHPKAVVPAYSTEGAAGMDLTAVSVEFDEYGNKVYHTGLAFEIPKGYAGFIFPRSSNAKTGLWLTNSVGIIDSDYRGEVTMKYKSSLRVITTLKIWFKFLFRKKKGLSEEDSVDVTNVWDNNDYKTGDRCGQIVILPYPQIEFIETDVLSETQRGTGGYGSTGR